MSLVLGLDPGLETTGFSLVDFSLRIPRLLDAGVIRTPRTLTFGERLHMIQKELREILREAKASACAVEKIFFTKNVKTAIQVAHGRGAALAVVAERGVPIFEYTPSQVKKSVAGNGRAGKPEIQEMIKRLLSLPGRIVQDDAADAVAVALCHGGASVSGRMQV